MDHSEEPLDRGYDSALLRRLLTYLRPYRWYAVAAVTLLLATAGLSLVGPFLTQQALDVAVPSRDAGLLGTLAMIFLLAVLVEFVGD
jgi:ATP-binding cassette subfamily B protein